MLAKKILSDGKNEISEAAFIILNISVCHPSFSIVVIPFRAFPFTIKVLFVLFVFVITVGLNLKRIFKGACNNVNALDRTNNGAVCDKLSTSSANINVY